MSMSRLEIRADDVLQCSNLTTEQKKALAKKSFFEWFLEADKPFKEHNYPMILAICSEGLHKEQEWVEYLEENADRYIFELHGLNHRPPNRLTKQQLYDELSYAKEEIESYFNCEVKNWYVPFGRKAKHPDSEWVCKKLGINLQIPTGKIDAKLWFKNKKIPHVNFHFWNEAQNKYVYNIISELCGKK